MIKKQMQGWGHGSNNRTLPSKWEALSSNPSTAKKEKSGYKKQRYSTDINVSSLKDCWGGQRKGQSVGSQALLPFQPNQLSSPSS
jgi:hypothetical protein